MVFCASFAELLKKAFAPTKAFLKMTLVSGHHLSYTPPNSIGLAVITLVFFPNSLILFSWVYALIEIGEVIMSRRN